tara:strand:- start:57 stop:356 length:300 start_codon:yes stop_codon:yes gene_type:complete
MALTKTVEYDITEVVGEYKAVQCREATIIKEDGVELSRTFHRHVLHPSSCAKNEDGSFTHIDTDISGEPAETQAICNAVWTDAVKAAWKTHCETTATGP